MMKFRPFFLALSAVALVSAGVRAEEVKKGPERWEKAIAEIEAREAAAKPAEGGLLFVGSSSIRLWDLAASWPDENVLNHGFGGSMLSDSVHFFDRLVPSFKPRAVILYAGDNDISLKRTAEQVLADFSAFAEKMERALPGVPLVYVAIKPSVKRWELWPEMKKANEAIAAICESREHLFFANIAASMLRGAEGAPDASWFAKDGLHLSPKGYVLWTLVIAGELKAAGALK